jgi:PAS domain S-box-containing protein
LAFSNDESDFKQNFTQLDSIMKQQLLYNEQFQSSSIVTKRALRSNIDPMRDVSLILRKQSIDTEPLPRTLADAMRPSKTRSIVITEKEAPYRIVNVNSCWEQMCGYSYVESKGKTLGSLLGGPKTDPLTATTMIAKLLQGEEDVGATLINYKRDGQQFQNRLRAGPIYNESGQITHFVGLLQEMIRDDVARQQVYA